MKHYLNGTKMSPSCSSLLLWFYSKFWTRL